MKNFVSVTLFALVASINAVPMDQVEGRFHKPHFHHSLTTPIVPFPTGGFPVGTGTAPPHSFPTGTGTAPHHPFPTGTRPFGPGPTGHFPHIFGSGGKDKRSLEAMRENVN